ncbi:MAG: hypothetical protein AAGF98_16385, partial [Cyanobacteria bacterium P01_H01_bin.153]
MASSLTRSTDGTSSPSIKPLGAHHSLGSTVISPKLISPLGANSLTVLQPFLNTHWVSSAGGSQETVSLQARSPDSTKSARSASVAANAEPQSAPQIQKLDSPSIGQRSHTSPHSDTLTPAPPSSPPVQKAEGDTATVSNAADAVPIQPQRTPDNDSLTSAAPAASQSPQPTNSSTVPVQAQAAPPT